MRNRLYLAVSTLVLGLLIVGCIGQILKAAASPRPEPSPSEGEYKALNAPGYCSSSGGSTEFEKITSVTLSENPDGSYKLIVQIYIANPTNCTVGEPCPEYDNSPEYVNAWVDWDGDQNWENSEKVLDKALTGYKAINYHGNMTAVSQFSLPSSVTSNPTWLRTNLGWNHDPNDPCEESWTWGNVVDKQVQFKHPEIKSITAEGVGTEGNYPETGSPVRLEANIDVPSGYELTKCGWTGDLPSGEGDPSNSCRYEYTPATGPGPDIDTYGEKKVSLTVAYKHTSSGAIGHVSKSHSYKVFFDKYGNDDGDCHWTRSLEACEPNWFEYWGDDGAVPGLSASDVSYNESISYGRYSGGQIEVGPAAAGSEGAYTVSSSNNCPGWEFPGNSGIDEAALTVAHERRHEEIDENWDTPSSNSCGEPDGPWGGCTDSDEGTPSAGYDDDLPDAFENNAGTSNSDVDSCDLEHEFHPDYKFYGDNEVQARLAELGVSGHPTHDWANPGKQAVPTPAQVPTPQAVQAQVYADGRMSGAASPNISYSEAAKPQFSSWGSLTGDYSDTGVDDDGDGLYDYLKLSVAVQVDFATSYYVIAWLEGSGGESIAWAKKEADLSQGSHTLELFFDGKVIRGRGIDGPYNIARVELRTAKDDYLVDGADSPYNTASYQSTDFESLAASFTDTFSDNGIDSNADGLYDILKINVGLNIRVSGTYTITGELENSDTIAVARKSVSLSPGNQIEVLNFDGQSIFQSGENGPYHLRRLRVEDSTGNLIDYIDDAYTTASYTYDQFQHGALTLSAVGHTDQGLDPDGDGKFEYLRVTLQVSVDQAGNYSLTADLIDEDGNTICDSELDLDLSSGSNTVTLDFPASPIYEHGVNGPYRVARVSLFDSEGDLSDYQQIAHTTQAYNYTDFSPPLVSLTGKYSDSGRDTDGDGRYNYLDIAIEVTPADSGPIFAQARLVDKEDQEIEWVENSKDMSANEAQQIILSFDGRLIHSKMANGPYKLRDLYVYHSGDPEQGVFKTQPYTTASYSYTEFDSDSPAVFRVSKKGDVYTDKAYYGQNFFSKGADIAEHIEVSEPVEPGDVVALDPNNPGQYRKSRKSYSTLVSGVISTQPGFTLGISQSLRGNHLQIKQPLLANRDLKLTHLSLSRLSKTFSPLPRSFRLDLSIKTLSQESLLLSRTEFKVLTLSPLKQMIAQSLLTQKKTSEPLLALMGVVPVKATTENGPIKPGDLLTSSSTPGHVMRCRDKEKCAGAIIGKALEPLREEGTGIIKMLVMR